MKKMQIRNTLVWTVFTLFSLVSMPSLEAQDWSKLDVEIQKDGKKLLHACVPGLVAPQFANYDFDGNGSEDLLVFDRSGGVLMPFVWRSGGESGRLEYDPSFVDGFPQLDIFVKMIDFDRDGDRDIFTFSQGGSSGISVYINEGTEASPDFNLLNFPVNFKDESALYTVSGDTPTEIYVASTDIPGIIDVDNDGDIDVLSFEPGGSTIVYYRNMQEERNLPKDSLVFIIADRCWGKFKEAGLNSNITIDPSGTGCAGGLTTGKEDSEQRHAGSTIELLDMNGDGLLDILLGDLSSDRLTLLVNGGTEEDAWMKTIEPYFPASTDTLMIRDFVSSFHVDVDNDGERELVATTNQRLGNQNINHIWLYENDGTDANPKFNLWTKNFLIEDSPAMPDASKPAFVDLTGDGLQDLLVGTLGYKEGSANRVASLFRFDNVGTASNPIYEFITNDYLGLSSDTTLSRIAPAVGDLDGDGDIDLLLGQISGELIYFENIGGAGAPASFTGGIYRYMGIDIGSTSKPFIIDMDEDGLPDILVGEQGAGQNETTMLIGSVNYFRNEGTAEVPIFVDSMPVLALGGVFTKVAGSTRHTSSPVVIPTSTGDDFLLFTGSENRELYLYEDIKGNLDGAFTQVSADLPVMNQGRETVFDMYDIDNDNYYEMVVGSYNGGIVFYNTPYQMSFDSATEEEKPEQDVSLYPNPAFDKVHIRALGKQPTRYALVSIDGSEVSAGTLTSSQIDISAIPVGVYIVSLYWEGGAVHKRLIVQH